MHFFIAKPTKAYPKLTLKIKNKKMKKKEKSSRQSDE